MNTVQAERNGGPRRAPRLWIVETLVVLGVLGFGYFAVTLDGARWTSDTATRTAEPLAELVSR